MGLILWMYLTGCAPFADEVVSPLPPPVLDVEAVRNNTLSGSVSGVRAEGATLEIRYLQSDFPQEQQFGVMPLIVGPNEGRPVQQFPVNNGAWAVSNLSLEPGLYQLRPQGDEYIFRSLALLFWVPPDTQWFYLNLNIDLLHRDDVEQEYGVPLCTSSPALEDISGDFVIPTLPPDQPTPTLTPTPTFAPVSAAPHPPTTPAPPGLDLPPGSCYVSHFSNWLVPTNSLSGTMSGLVDGQIGSLMIYNIPLSESQRAALDPFPPSPPTLEAKQFPNYFPYAVEADTGAVYEPALTLSEWALVEEIPLTNGPWLLTNARLGERSLFCARSHSGSLHGNIRRAFRLSFGLI